MAYGSSDWYRNSYTPGPPQNQGFSGAPSSGGYQGGYQPYYIDRQVQDDAVDPRLQNQRDANSRLRTQMKSINKAPTFDAPEFNAPTWEGLQGDQGYQSRLGAGTDAIERSAAARGVLRTGGTLKDIMSFGQDLGTAEFDKAYGRSQQEWQRGFDTESAKMGPEAAKWAASRKALNTGRGGGGWQNIPAPPSAPPAYEY